MVCPKCFESNEDSAEFCVECGAPLTDSADASMQDAYKDLARANLLRMRGDMKAASDVCLSILKRYPNNPTAHSLLGDIYADQGEYEQAATWYEMALDLAPDSAADQLKLAHLRERIQLRESAEAARQIGIPETPARPWPLIVLAVVALVAVAAGAYVLGKAQQGIPTPSESVVQTPANVGPKVDHAPAPSTPETENQGQQSTEHPVPSAGPDAALLQTLQSKGTEKLEYTSCLQDPRGPVAIVTVAAVPNESHHVTATRAGLEFFRVLPAFAKVTVRVQTDQGIAFVADMTHDAAKTAEAALSGGDTIESQSQVMLSSVWSAQRSGEPAPEKSETK